MEDEEATPQYLLADHHHHQFDYLRYKDSKNTIIKKSQLANRCRANVSYLQQPWQIEAHVTLPRRSRS